MFTKTMKTMMVGAAVLSMAGVAQAATVDINLYGASAQHLFWNDAADNFLTSMGCTGVAQDEYNSRHGITRGTCGSDTVYIRYSSKASFDGIYAVKGAVNTDNCPSAFQRKVVNEATCSDWVLGGTACSGLKCMDITLGASDVDGASFVQESHGNLSGPAGGGWVDRVFPPSGISTSGLTSYQPLVVPFGFFAHKSVTKTKCLGPDPTEPTPGAVKAVSTWGYQCYDDNNDGKSEDCIGYYTCVSGRCSGGVRANQTCSRANECPDVTLADTRCERIPLDNISRLMATMIYSGQVYNWQDFGAWYSNVPVVACLRHAGSGTAAALDWTVMRSNRGDWGWPLVKSQKASNPVVWFNDSSSELMNCVNSLSGAIGYADADQLEGTANYPNVVALKYQGVEPRRTKVRNGEYEFYTNQWLYSRTLTNPLLTWVRDLVAYASDPENVPSTKARFWATLDEMQFNRPTDDAYPGFVGANNPQTP